MYSRERGVYPTNTNDTAAEREFYSPLQEGAVTLDDEITAYEEKLLDQLTNIRSAAVGETIDPRLASETIVHLAIRNAHVRDTFEAAADQLVAGASDLFTDRDWVKEQLGMDKPIEQSRMKAEIRKTISEKFPQLGLMERNRIETMLVEKIEKEFDSFMTQQTPQISTMLSKLATEIQPMSKNAHVKALSSGLAPEKRIERLSELSWIKISGDFILSDSVVLAFCDGREKPYILADLESTEAIFFPVTSNIGVWGARDDSVKLPQTFLEFSASCSRDFFVAKSKRNDLLTLRPLIGTLARTEMDELTRSTISDLKRDGLGPPKTG